MTADERTQYEQVCKDEFQEIKDRLDGFSQRLFIDNGTESFQSKLNRHDRWMKTVIKMMSVVALAVLGMAVTMTIWAIQNHFKSPLE